MAMQFAISSFVILWLVYRSMRNLAHRNERPRQSQKLEIISGLTAGAHDFNNNMTAVRENIEQPRASEAYQEVGVGS